MPPKRSVWATDSTFHVSHTNTRTRTRIPRRTYTNNEPAWQQPLRRGDSTECCHDPGGESAPEIFSSLRILAAMLSATGTIQDHCTRKTITMSSNQLVSIPDSIGCVYMPKHGSVGLKNGLK
ncbi:hypothetical protein PTTG_25186 [Puccinia triticina 1-1 BBBD Race 1]|uniref:Uncharacterized protein n=1 Tax=Puccinia triticina (isolate 1-1 / race 1 (BBBD)) TaxID=630390 RepID=A0A180H6K2_PUCT1|nr:hypothetical protein PTTG_25186 [Puccinia triticina 1-1 BBBD Race 1]